MCPLHTSWIKTDIDIYFFYYTTFIEFNLKQKGNVQVIDISIQYAMLHIQAVNKNYHLIFL